ncbi:uncharacterized protein [Linepithema humile]|uniref:uncharacterized protein n=1 Tax=Linepithema humile TaxID=83485 RepID=UPI00351F1003
MGSLPVDRIKPTRAFTITGVDFAGPIVTLVNKGQGAKRELSKLYAFICSSINGSVGDALQERGIEWSFISLYPPHLGGLWEARVKSCKYHLKLVMGNTLFTFEELTTSLVQIEACLNSRPLSPLSSDLSDLQPLTPGHFLIGEPLNSLPENDLTDVGINRLDRWEKIQRSVQDFWKRWAVEYVSNLQSRVKWKSRQENVKINDLVLLKDDNLPPLKWKTGRVTELHAGKDNLVRVVIVRTANDICKRAIAKLCKLHVSDDTDKKD